MARDFLHNTVKSALINDGWAITHDPFPITFGIRRVYADLGAEKLIAATKAQEKIVVEVKSFVGVSKVTDLERAIGQYAVYKSWLKRTESEYRLYIGIDREAFVDVFQDVSGQVLLEDYGIGLIIVDADQEEIIQWIE